MKIINYILEGFGFQNYQDYAKSSFGFVYSSAVVINNDDAMGYFDEKEMHADVLDVVKSLYEIPEI